MKKVYEIRKYVVAESITQAIKIEKSFEPDEVYITKHSTDILLDDLHTKKDKEKSKGKYKHMDGSVVCKECELTDSEGCRCS